jgi:importin subunit beta-1
VSTLSTNTTHSNVDIQRSAMLTLGSICDKLAINNIRPSKEDIDAIMTGVAGGLVEEQKNDQIKLTAIKALQDSIPMFKEELQKDASRDFFLTLILKNATHTNEEIVLKAVQCLIDIIKTCYRYLHNRYMDVILDCTIALMKKNAPSIVVATTEFWDSVAQYEVKLLEKKQNEDSSIIFHNIVASYSPKITQTLLENLMKKDTEDIDSGMSVHAVTLDCLIHVNALAGESNKSLNIEFISNQIGGENDKSKVAALLCFEAMILGYNQDIVNLIDSSFANIVEFLKINATVCKAALKVITAISEKYPSFMLIDKVTNIWLEILIKIVHSDISLASPVFTIFGSSLHIT